MTRIIVASDSFKGSATSIQIADYLENGILRANSTIDVKKMPIADGGEGTVRCIIEATNGQLFEQQVLNPLGKTISATWGMIDAETAILEMAEAAGLPQLGDHLDVAHASTYGVGQLVLAALDHHAKKIYVGLGGSATNDGGVGMAQALGARFLNSKGHELQGGVSDLKELKTIDLTTMDPRLMNVEIIGLSDVNNPLTGSNGASYIFGAQKGASLAQQSDFDEALHYLAESVKSQLKLDFEQAPGAGAAGGLGYGLLAFCHGKIESGIQQVMKLICLEEQMQTATVVVTGEGQIDGQSLGGKVPIGVAKLAKKYHLPVIAVVGSVGDNAENIYDHGIDLILSTTLKPMTVKTAIEHVQELVEYAGFTLVKAIEIGQMCKPNASTT